MPSDQTGSAGLGGQAQSGTSGSATSGLLDSQGRAYSNVRGQLQQTGGQMDEFIRTEPLAAVLIALGIGYILGRLGL
jgi:ElaB/YqjD/DUF883 family membrane-anchored ribosome-binding protein